MKKLRTPAISGLAVVTAQAIDVLTSGAVQDDGTPHTVDSATALVLKTREAAKLPLPEPAELVEALAYLERMRERDSA